MKKSTFIVSFLLTPLLFGCNQSKPKPQPDPEKETCHVTFNGFDHLKVDGLGTKFEKDIDKGSNVSWDLSIVPDELLPEYCHYLIPTYVDAFVNDTLLTDDDEHFNYSYDASKNIAHITITDIQDDIEIVAHPELDFHHLVYKYDETDSTVALGDIYVQSTSLDDDVVVDWGDGKYYVLGTSSIEKIEHNYAHERTVVKDYYDIRVYSKNVKSEFVSRFATAKLSGVNVGYYSGGNANITSIELGNTISNLSINAFAAPTDVDSLLQSAYISAIKTGLGLEMFLNNKNMTEFMISRDASFNSLMASVLSGTSVKKLILPDAVTELQSGAFEGMGNIESLVFRPDSKISKIGGNSFADGGNGLKKLYLPSSITTIESNGLSGCSSLTDIYCATTSKPDGWDNNWKGSATGEIHWDSPQYPGYTPKP